MVRKWTVGFLIAVAISIVASLVGIAKGLQGQKDYFLLLVAFGAWVVCIFLLTVYLQSYSHSKRENG